MLPTNLAKLSAIFRLVPELPSLRYLPISLQPKNLFRNYQNFEITIFAEILNIVEKFRKASKNLGKKIFAKLSL